MLDELHVACPTWASATILIRDAEGRIVGYGWVNRDGRVRVEADAAGVRLLEERPHLRIGSTV